MTTLKQLENWQEGEKRIKLEEIENQILQLNNEDVGGVDIKLNQLSTEEEVYRNDLVSEGIKLNQGLSNYHSFC